MSEHSIDWRRERLLDAASDDPGHGEPARHGVPGKATLIEGLLVQRLASDVRALAADAERLVSRAASSAGEPLPTGLRSRFESSLGVDLGAVRVHTGSSSTAAADAVRARAYTVGNDIHFADGE